MALISIEAITLDADLQPRVILDDATVARYVRPFNEATSFQL